MSRRDSQLRVLRAAEAAIRKSADPTRHRCFVSYQVADEAEVTKFIDEFGTAFIPTVVGITEDDDFVDSDDTDYIMNRIREEYLSDSTVTIVLVGKCTWSRRFIDWEVYSSLRRYKGYPPSGLMAITLPSIADYGDRRPPDRVMDNVVETDKGYARWWKYPDSQAKLRGYIGTAFDSRTNKVAVINNSRERMVRNRDCT